MSWDRLAARREQDARRHRKEGELFSMIKRLRVGGNGLSSWNSPVIVTPTRKPRLGLVKKHVLFNPERATPFGAKRIVLNTEPLAELFEPFHRAVFRVCLLRAFSQGQTAEHRYPMKFTPSTSFGSASCYAPASSVYRVLCQVVFAGLLLVNKFIQEPRWIMKHKKEIQTS